MHAIRVGHWAVPGMTQDEAAADEGVDLDADRATDVEKVEVEGVNEEGDEAGDEEDAVPPENDVAAGVEDAPGLPWLMTVEVDRDGGQRRTVEGEGRPAKGEEEMGAVGAHHPRRRGEDEAAVAMGGRATRGINEGLSDGDRWRGLGLGIGWMGARWEPREAQRFPERVEE